MKILLLVALAIASAAIYQKSLVLGLPALAFLGAAMTTKLTRSPQSLAMLATSVLVCWTALEAAFALMETPPSADVVFLQPDSERPATYWRASDTLGTLPSKGVHRARKADITGEVIYDVIYTIDADGFRQPPKPGPEDGEHVYFLGGSATFGEGLNDDQTLPWEFSRLYPERWVRNMAVSGWGLHQAYTVWQNQITEPGATVIVQTAPWHADRAACIPKYSGLSPRYEMVGDGLERTGRCRSWFDNQALSRAMLESHLLQRLYDVGNNGHAGRKIDLYFATLQEMGELASERGQCFIVAFNKAREDYMADAGYSNQDIVERLSALGLDIVDTTLAERKEDLDPVYFIRGDGHPTGAANEAKAALLSPASERCDQKLLAQNNR
ncbi:MAG: hypothetical protein OEU92_25830 [Alphaproteobacteria bacterium]|nr:hypothetical protein [Alphaproteobacteria bacterium]